MAARRHLTRDNLISALALVCMDPFVECDVLAEPPFGRRLPCRMSEPQMEDVGALFRIRGDALKALTYGHHSVGWARGARDGGGVGMPCSEDELRWSMLSAMRLLSSFDTQYNDILPGIVSSLLMLSGEAGDGARDLALWTVCAVSHAVSPRNVPYIPEEHQYTHSMLFRSVLDYALAEDSCEIIGMHDDVRSGMGLDDAAEKYDVVIPRAGSASEPGRLIYVDQ